MVNARWVGSVRRRFSRHPRFSKRLSFLLLLLIPSWIPTPGPVGWDLARRILHRSQHRFLLLAYVTAGWFVASRERRQKNPAASYLCSSSPVPHPSTGHVPQYPWVSALGIFLHRVDLRGCRLGAPVPLITEASWAADPSAVRPERRPSLDVGFSLMWAGLFFANTSPSGTGPS
jgi:hypothetical protein